MDNISKLQALMGEQDVSGDSNNWVQIPAKPQHLYEGTDSEDDEVITSRGAVAIKPTIPKLNFTPTPGKSLLYPICPLKGSETDFAATQSAVKIPPRNFKDYKLQVGELAPEGESFCPFQTIKKYPHVYVSNANRQRVAEGFFDRGKLYERTWDL